MKSIKWLNEHWWYRLIKVMYIIFLTLIIVIPPFVIINEYKPKFDNDSSYIKCANGKEFILSKNNIYLYNDYMWSHDKDKATSLCFDGSIEYTNYGTGIWKDLTVPKITSTTENSGKYQLISIYKNRDWTRTLGFSLVSTVVIIILFELIRRIFYYVILGSIRPPKS